MEPAPYRCEAASIPGFIQQVAVSYVAKGYFYYVMGWIPEHKRPRDVDSKLIERYGIGMSKWARCRRRKAGCASVQYIRYDRLFLLLATDGEHTIFREEAKAMRDCRRVPIKCFGYAVSSKRGHAHVRIQHGKFVRLKGQLLDLANRASLDRVERALRSLPFEPYKPVIRQVLELRRAVNRALVRRGLPKVAFTHLRFLRRIVRPFEEGRQGQTDGSRAGAGSGGRDESPSHVPPTVCADL